MGLSFQMNDIIGNIIILYVYMVNVALPSTQSLTTSCGHVPCNIVILCLGFVSVLSETLNGDHDLLYDSVNMIAYIQKYAT